MEAHTSRMSSRRAEGSKTLARGSPIGDISSARLNNEMPLEFIPAENYAVPTDALRRLLTLIVAQAGQRTERPAS